MSKRSLSDAPPTTASSDPSKRPRHFHAGPNPQTTDEQQSKEEEQASAVDPSPICRLHRHALESILGFCAVTELSGALQVSREWNAAVQSMKSIGFAFTANFRTLASRLSALLQSPLSRHLGAVEQHSIDVDAALMNQLAQRAPELRRLACLHLPPVPHALSLPSKLQEVALAFRAESSVAQVHAIFAALNALSKLEELSLSFHGAVATALNFALLHPPALRFVLIDYFSADAPFSNELLDSFRTPFFAHLDHFQLPFQMDSARLAHLTRRPHNLRWKHIPNPNQLIFGFIEGDTAVLLNLAETMTTLKLWPTRDVSFLPQLRQLTALELSVYDFTNQWAMQADAVVTAFDLPSLTELRLCAPLTSVDIAALLSRVPLLTSLSLVDVSKLESLAFLSECVSMRVNLQRLSLVCWTAALMHSSELYHLFSLKALTSLDLSESFVESLDSFARGLFTPPSRAFPKLKHFAYMP